MTMGFLDEIPGIVQESYWLSSFALLTIGE
jgi:hypothetical protein